MTSPNCTECGRPVLCGQGARHLSCSPICERCYLPITSKDKVDNGTHAHCAAVAEEDHA